MRSTIPLHVTAWLNDMGKQIETLLSTNKIDDNEARKTLLNNHLVLLSEMDNILNGESYFIGAPRVRSK